MKKICPYCKRTILPTLDACLQCVPNQKRTQLQPRVQKQQQYEEKPLTFEKSKIGESMKVELMVDLHPKSLELLNMIAQWNHSTISNIVEEMIIDELDRYRLAALGHETESTDYRGKPLAQWIRRTRWLYKKIEKETKWNK